MNGTAEEPAGRELEELHATLLKLLAMAPEQRASLIQDFVLHPVFQSRLRQACSAVFAEAARFRALQSDILQEAMYLVIRQLNANLPQYTDEGVDHFGGWLWTVLQNAVRQARRGHFREARSFHLRADLDARSVQAPGPELERNDLWTRVLVIIQEIENRGVYEAMIDWVAGLKGVESAKLRGVSPSAISKRRKCGVDLLRQRLRDER